MPVRPQSPHSPHNVTLLGGKPPLVRMVAHAVPGLGSLLADECRKFQGVTIRSIGCDGRSDLVLFELHDPSVQPKSSVATIVSARLAEDVFVEVGRTLRSEGDNPRWIAGRLWRPAGVRRALTAWEGVRERHRTARVGFRVVVRVLHERSFARTELRRQLASVIRKSNPQWVLADPADLEIWVSEYREGQFVAAIRLSNAQMRQHGGRVVERPGALRPTVAAAMVQLAGTPHGRLLDACCGSGTILAEAEQAGWSVIGQDLDPSAVTIARCNVPEVPISVGDVHRLPFADRSIEACVSNLPFGKRYQMPGKDNLWLEKTLAELTRVTVSGGRIVILRPQVPRRLQDSQLRCIRRVPIRLLGVPAALWAYERV